MLDPIDIANLGHVRGLLLTCEFTDLGFSPRVDIVLEDFWVFKRFDIELGGLEKLWAFRRFDIKLDGLERFESYLTEYCRDLPLLAKEDRQKSC